MPVGGGGSVVGRIRRIFGVPTVVESRSRSIDTSGRFRPWWGRSRARIAIPTGGGGPSARGAAEQEASGAPEGAGPPGIDDLDTGRGLRDYDLLSWFSHQRLPRLGPAAAEQWAVWDLPMVVLLGFGAAYDAGRWRWAAPPSGRRCWSRSGYTPGQWLTGHSNKRCFREHLSVLSQ